MSVIERQKHITTDSCGYSNYKLWAWEGGR